MTANTNGQYSRLENLEANLTQGFADLLEVHKDTNKQLKEMTETLISAAVGKDHVPLQVVKWLVGGSVLFNLILIVWFTGISPRIGGDGVTFGNRVEAASR
jgi:hypothetical protein